MSETGEVVTDLLFTFTQQNGPGECTVEFRRGQDKSVAMFFTVNGRQGAGGRVGTRTRRRSIASSRASSSRPSKGHGGEQPGTGAAGPSPGSHVERRVERLGADRLDLAEHVAFVHLTPIRVDQAQRLAVVAPVRRVQPVRLLEVRDGVAREAGPVQVLRELEVGGGQPELGRARRSDRSMTSAFGKAY